MKNRRIIMMFEKIVFIFSYLFKNYLYLLFYFFNKLTLQKEISVLVYHAIDLHKTYHVVHPNEFIKQMDYIRKNYCIISLDDIIDYVKGKKILFNKSVAITFDDGYYNIYSNVYPYFKKYNLPLTIFLTTGFCNKKKHLDNIQLKMLSWKEIIEMSDNNVIFGAHTVNHPNLNEINIIKAKNEIIESKKEIEKKIRKKVVYFAYPSDKYNNEIIKLIKKSNYRGAFNGGEKLIKVGDNPFILNRISINRSVNFMMFKAQLTKAVDLYNNIEQDVKFILNKMKIISTINKIYNNI